MPGIRLALLNTSPFWVPKIIPSGATDVTRIDSEVAVGIPVVVALKLAAPSVIPVTFTVQAFAVADNVQ